MEHSFNSSFPLEFFFRTSQFIIGLNRYLEAMNNKFSVGMRFKMRFEGEDSPERRYLVLILFFECCLLYP